MPQLNNSEDTIAAIATPLGLAGIGIVRLSGKDALCIADNIFRGKNGLRPSQFKSYTVHYGWIVNNKPKASGQGLKGTKHVVGSRKHGIIDEVILTVMKRPGSYTKEDIVEINCHSGIANLKKIMDLVLKSGARLAEPGEFTKRAFLNGRIDLTQAEAVLDIIQSKTEESLKLGIEQLKGGLSSKINNIRHKLLEMLANIEAAIDFPEEDIETTSIRRINSQIHNIERELKSLLNNAAKGKILREGIKIVICGKPNVGKSSLLNVLLQEKRAIVTSIAGTTRDTIEETVNLKGFPVRFFDTAGIIRPKDIIEKEAVRRSHQEIESGDLILLVLDGSKALEKEDKSFIAELKEKRKIIVINKIDLPQRINISKLSKSGIKGNIVRISALKQKGLVELENSIVKNIWPNKLTGSEELLISNMRHIALVRKSLNAVERAEEVIDNKLPFEFISFEIKESIKYLDAITGKRIEEDLLDKIFSEFCIGK